MGIPGPGERIAGGKYEIERVIGRGGMGVVVAAQHRQLRERVAIKFLLPQPTDREGSIKRFLREAQAAVRIKSEHVVRILDVDALPDGNPYIVMEFLVGADLGEILSLCGPMPVHEAVGYVLQACTGTAEAHACGIVHRDLKPDNLFVTDRADGSVLVKVLDFGISKALQPGVGVLRLDLTSTRSALGSPLYMSPEQFRNSRETDFRTDVWALGIVLHELVTGRLPFEGPNAAALAVAICADAPIPLLQHCPSAPPELEAIVLRCLEKDPDRRFRDVDELGRELRALSLSPYSDADKPRWVPTLRDDRVAEARSRPIVGPQPDTVASGAPSSAPRPGSGGPGSPLVLVDPSFDPVDPPRGAPPAPRSLLRRPVTLTVLVVAVVCTTVLLLLPAWRGERAKVASRARQRVSMQAAQAGPASPARPVAAMPGPPTTPFASPAVPTPVITPEAANPGKPLRRAKQRRRPARNAAPPPLDIRWHR